MVADKFVTKLSVWIVLSEHRLIVGIVGLGRFEVAEEILGSDHVGRLVAALAFRGPLRGAGVLRGGMVDLRPRARTARYESSSSPEARPEISTSSSEVGMSNGSRA